MPAANLPSPPAPATKQRIEANIVPTRLITNSIGMRLTLIPADQFLMGSPPNDTDAEGDDKPRHG